MHVICEYMIYTRYITVYLSDLEMCRCVYVSLSFHGSRVCLSGTTSAHLVTNELRRQASTKMVKRKSRKETERETDRTREGTRKEVGLGSHRTCVCALKTCRSINLSALKSLTGWASGRARIESECVWERERKKETDKGRKSKRIRRKIWKRNEK